jgi:hypothetical protein
MLPLNIKLGDVFGNWTVLEPGGPNRWGQLQYRCRCKCGRVKVLLGSSLKSGKTSSCRSCASRMQPKDTRRGGRKPIELPIGSKFGDWTVIGKVERPEKKNAESHCVCRCKCGLQKRVSAFRLRKGKAMSCLKCAARRLPFDDLVGRRFGHWTVIRRIPAEERGDRNVSWHCRCDCGTEKMLSTKVLNHCGACRKCWIHPNRLRPYEALFNATRARIINRYDRSKTQEFTLIYEDFHMILSSNRCHYCGRELNVHPFGKSKSYCIDRKDNSKGYTLENSVPCCKRCNYGKGARFSYEEWHGMTEYLRRPMPAFELIPDGYSHPASVLPSNNNV